MSAATALALVSLGMVILRPLMFGKADWILDRYLTKRLSGSAGCTANSADQNIAVAKEAASAASSAQDTLIALFISIVAWTAGAVIAEREGETSWAFGLIVAGVTLLVPLFFLLPRLTPSEKTDGLRLPKSNERGVRRFFQRLFNRELVTPWRAFVLISDLGFVLWSLTM